MLGLILGCCAKEKILTMKLEDYCNRDMLHVYNIVSYVVTLHGQRIGGYQPSFKSFTLVTESSCRGLSPLENGIFRHRNLGNFTVMGTDKAQYSNHCPNSVTHISSERKTEVNVTWTAPPPGSGCIVFRYMNCFQYVSYIKVKVSLCIP
jgi:hypothetical protein